MSVRSHQQPHGSVVKKHCNRVEMPTVGKLFHQQRTPPIGHTPARMHADLLSRQSRPSRSPVEEHQQPFIITSRVRRTLHRESELPRGKHRLAHRWVGRRQLAVVNLAPSCRSATRFVAATRLARGPRRFVRWLLGCLEHLLRRSNDRGSHLRPRPRRPRVAVDVDLMDRYRWQQHCSKQTSAASDDTH